MFYFIALIYILLIIIFTLSIEKISQSQRKYIFGFLIILGCVIISFRPESVPDYEAYKRFFEYIEPLKNYGFSLINRHYATGFEYGFVYIISFFKIFVGNNYRVLWFSLSIVSTYISISSLYQICKNVSPETIDDENEYVIKTVALGIYSSCFFLCYQGIAIRGAFSIAFCLLAFNLLLRKKYLFMLVAVVMAFMMQRIALVFLLALAIYKFIPVFHNKRNYLYTVVTILLLILLIYFTPLYGLTLGRMQMLYNNLFDVINYRGYVENVSLHASFDKKRLFLFVIAILTLFWGGVLCSKNLQCIPGRNCDSCVDNEHRRICKNI